MKVPRKWLQLAMIGLYLSALNASQGAENTNVGRGSVTVSRLANLYQDDKRYIGFGFLAVGYVPPDPEGDYEKTKAAVRVVCPLVSASTYEKVVSQV